MTTLISNKINFSHKSIKVPEVSNVEQNNRVFRANEKKGLPFLGIKKGTKYGKIEYDFIATYHQLKEPAQDMVQDLFEEMGFYSKLYKLPVVCSCGKIYGVSLKCELDICRRYAPKIKEIVFNPDNWDMSPNGEYMKAIDEKDSLAYLRCEMKQLRK